MVLKNTMKRKIAFVGAGEIGTAIFDLIKHRKDFEITRWDADETKVPGQDSLENTVHGAGIVFLCVPSKYVRLAASSFNGFLNDAAIVVSISKGIELVSKKTMDAVLQEVLPEGQKFALLSGPMLGEELSDGLIGAAVIASESEEARSILTDTFNDSRLKTTEADSTYGVALTGVFKNVYAIAFGAFESLAYGTNAKGWLFSQAIEEMHGMIELLGGEGDAAYGMSGIGDLIATGFSAYSSNYTLGYELAREAGRDLESEGKISMPSIVEMLGDDFEKFKIAHAVKRVVLDGEDAKDVFDDLLT